MAIDQGLEHLAAWRDVLDELTYYELFGVATDADADDIHAAFHAFCDSFHPDRHIGHEASTLESIATVFKRGTEAYAVLSDVVLRRQYDDQLSGAPTRRPPRASFSPLSRPPSRGPGSNQPLEDSVRSPSARPFARRAEELIAKGDLRQAKLQLVMAKHMDPENEALENAMRVLEEKLGSPK